MSSEELPILLRPLSTFPGVGAVVGGVALLFGAVMVVTGTTQKCPANKMVGVDTTD